MYSQILWNHLHEPQNRRQLAGANAIGDSRFAKCNDHLIVQLQIVEESIQEACFLAKACGPVVAAASVATGLLRGMTTAQARAITWMEIDKTCGGLPPPKRHALWMFLEALHGALDRFDDQKTQPDYQI